MSDKCKASSQTGKKFRRAQFQGITERLVFKVSVDNDFVDWMIFCCDYVDHVLLLKLFVFKSRVLPRLQVSRLNMCVVMVSLKILQLIHNLQQQF